MGQKRLSVVLALALVGVVSLAGSFVTSTARVPVSPLASAFREAVTAAAQDPLAVEAALGLDRPTRRLIQQGLRSEGFDPGAPDGLFGPRTRDAIRSWQEAQGLPATSYLDDGQVDRLRTAGVPTPAAESTPAADCEAWNTEEFFKTVTAEDVAVCLTAGASVAARDEARHTPLHWAAWSSNEPAVIEALLAGGADLEARNGGDGTPLLRAAWNNENPAVVEALLSAGADLTARSEDGLTATHLAGRYNSNSAVVQLLVAAEADLGAQPRPGREGSTPAPQPPDDGQLPPDILVDSYLLRAEQSVRDRDRSGARAAMQQLVALQEEHELVPVPEYHYRYARVWNAVGVWDRGLASARRYLQLTGRDGEHYLDALTVMNEATAAVEEADRQRARRAAEEARRRAAAERARAAAERQLNATRAVLAQMKFAPIPPGQFTMGPSTREERIRASTFRFRRTPADYRKRREVRITRPFEMARYKVTKSEWEMVMGSLPRTMMGGDPPQCDRCPITYVNWDDVQRFVSVLNTASGNSHTYRLPTEAEWEYAARAGENGDRFVRDVGESAWHEDNSGNRLHPVGLKRPNRFGLYDMVGNALEWTQDIWGYYPGDTTVEDPQGPRLYNGFRDEPAYVVRGCDYNSDREYCEKGGSRMGFRGSGLGSGSYDLGFRLVRTER